MKKIIKFSATNWWKILLTIGFAAYAMYSGVLGIAIFTVPILKMWGIN